MTSSVSSFGTTSESVRLGHAGQANLAYELFTSYNPPNRKSDYPRSPACGSAQPNSAGVNECAHAPATFENSLV